MSNRRRPRNAPRSRRPRCPKCRCLDFNTKEWADGTKVRVCRECEHTW